MPSRVVALVLLAALVAVSVSRSGAPAEARPAQAPGLLAHTRSYYVGNASHDAATRLGCDNGDTQGRMTLFFGAPTEVAGQFGTTLWGGADRTAPDAGELVKDFIRGFAWCRRSPTQQILVGMGTSNSTIDRRNDVWVVGHGEAWGRAVRDTADWADRYFPGVAKVYGAWDAEPSWSAHQKAELWMQGYNAVPGRRLVHANFSADGCPRDTATGGPCNNGWTQYHVWRLSWQYDPSLPIPQIYATSGVNARQWQKIDEFGARVHNDGMTFSGAMAQHGACMQVGGCGGIDNTPQAAHDFLLRELNANPVTRQPTMESATDMHWHR